MLQDLDYLRCKINMEQEHIDQTYHRSNDINKLREDFYANTFISYVYIDDPKEILGIDNLRHKRISEGEVARNLMSCAFIFLIQMSLVGFAFYNLYTE